MFKGYYVTSKQKRQKMQCIERRKTNFLKAMVKNAALYKSVVNKTMIAHK